MQWNPTAGLQKEQRAALRQAGFTSAQIDRLLLYRAAYRDSYYDDDPTAPARLHFARWLYLHGKISG